MQAATGRIAEHLRQQHRRRVVGVCARHQVVSRHDEGRAAIAPRGHAAIAVLCRLKRVDRRQHTRRLRDRPKRRLHTCQHPRHIETAGHDHGRVVGLVVRTVESLQARDVDVLDIAARADRAVAIGVPLVHRGHGALQQHLAGVVLATLQLVAHHRHFGVQVFARDKARDHRIGLPAQVPVQRLVVGGKGGEVVGAVVAGRAVGAQAAPGEFAPRCRRRRRAFEQQVLEQMRHAGLADVLLPRADAVGHVDRRRRFTGVGHQQHLQAVGQAVFGDAFDGGGFDRQGGLRRCSARQAQRDHGGGEQTQRCHRRNPRFREVGPLRKPE